MVKISFLGSCREVGRSAILIESKNGTKCMFDYGIRFRGEERLPFEVDFDDLNAIALTHCHIDHSGAIPYLYKDLEIPFYTNPVTLKVIETLIKDILQTADLESGSVVLEKSKNNLSQLIRTCVNDLKGFADSRNHIINLMIHSELVAEFEKRQIRQALNNILSNAIKYTPPYGKIDINSQIDNNFIMISIKDTGIGLSRRRPGEN